jgi:hypothetical protein
MPKPRNWVLAYLPGEGGGGDGADEDPEKMSWDARARRDVPRATKMSFRRSWRRGLDDMEEGLVGEGWDCESG